MEIEVQEKHMLSCFFRNKDGAAICPTGNVMYKIADRGRNAIYQCRDAWRQCPNRCMGSSNYKTVSFAADTECIPVLMFGNSRQKLQSIPEGVNISPYNHVLDRKTPEKK